MRRLENYDQSQVWEAWIKDDTVLYQRTGVVGAPWRLSVERFSSRPEAEHALQERIDEKLGEAWVDLGEHPEEDASPEIETTEGETLESRSVEELELSVRTTNALMNAGISTVGELTAYSPSDLIAMGFGRKSVRELSDVLAELGLSLSAQDEDESDEDEEDDDSEEYDEDDDSEESEEDDDSEESEEDDDAYDEDEESDEDEDDEDEEEYDEDEEEESDEDEDDEEYEDEEYEDEDEDEEPARERSQRARASHPSLDLEPSIPPPPPPPPPRLPVRVSAKPAGPLQWTAAGEALAALTRPGGRSWKRARLARRARRALARLGGVDPMAHGTLASSFGAAMAEAVRPSTRSLSLSAALGLLYVSDPSAFVRTVREWSTASPSPTIAALRLVVDQLPDPEVALHVGTALTERRLPAPAWRQRFAQLRPVLVEELEKSGTTLDAFLAALRGVSSGDPILVARIEEAAR